jgi:succinate dehydrogenase/fumarate reductase flavoprotein subunit
MKADYDMVILGARLAGLRAAVECVGQAHVAVVRSFPTFPFGSSAGHHSGVGQ